MCCLHAYASAKVYMPLVCLCFLLTTFNPALFTWCLSQVRGKQLIQLATPNLEGFEYSITSQPLNNLLDVEKLLYVFVKCLVFQMFFSFVSFFQKKNKMVLI